MGRAPKWIWYAETPKVVPAGARISAGKSGNVAKSLPASAAAASGGALSEIELLRAELEKERRRSQEFEATLARLQKQQSGAQEAIADLQSRLRSPLGSRDPAQLVYVLGAFCALLTLLLLFLLWRRPRSSRWWDASRQAPLTDIGPETQPRLDSRHPKVDPPWLREAPLVARRASSSEGTGPDSSIGGLEVTAVPDHALLFALRDEEQVENGGTRMPSAPSPRTRSEGEQPVIGTKAPWASEGEYEGSRLLENTMPLPPAAPGKPIALDFDLSLVSNEPLASKRQS